MSTHEIILGEMDLSDVSMWPNKNTINIGECQLYDQLQESMIKLEEYDFNKPLGSGKYWGNFHISAPWDCKDVDGSDWSSNSSLNWMKYLQTKSPVVRLGWYTSGQPSHVSYWSGTPYAGGSISLNFEVGTHEFHITIANKRYFTISKFSEMVNIIKHNF